MNNLYKLFTKEDRFNTHKILGSLALINFIYQFSNLYFHKQVILGNTLIIHGMLSLTSLIFKISSQRHSKIPIIYPELRLHSIIFAFRSIICCYLDNIYLKMLVCFLTMIEADIATYFTKKGTTIRNFPQSEFMNDEDRKNIVYHYSRSQISATIFMLCNPTTSFFTLFAIQIVVFLMTLVKKNIIHPHTLHIVYSLSLWVNAFSYFSLTAGNVIINVICANIFAYLRFENNISKYISWIIVFIIYRILLENLDYLNSFFPTLKHHNLFIGILIAFYIIKNLLTHTSLFSKRYM